MLSCNDNIAIGAYSNGQTATQMTGPNGRNVSIGHYAAYNLTNSPSNNIAIGYQSMYNATNPSDNICIGTNSGNSITSGGGNIAIGGSSTSTASTLTNGQGNNIGVGIASNLYISNGSVNNIGLGAYSNFNSSTGCSNISIGTYTQALSSTGCSNIIISTNGTSGVPISGRGDNTALIDARSGLYSYSPAYCTLYATAYNNSTVTWAFFNDGVTTYNNGFTLYNSDQLVVQPFQGLYEITISGTTLAQASLYADVALNVNNVKNYTIAYQSSSAINGYLVNVSGTQLSRPYVSGTPTSTGWSVSVGGSRWYSNPYTLYMTIKFISL